MKLTIRKVDVTDAVSLEKLVIEHIDGIEPGLSVVDSRLMLGHATIDLIAQDAAGSLVLVAIGSRADENMLLRVVDAYSWCIEYPESVQRHYPTLAVSEERPPRVVFVMSRVPESFQRKIKQLSFPSVDAVEFHHLEVDGVPAVFFDSISRIRRGVPAMDVAAAVVPRPVRVAVEPPKPAPMRVAVEAVTPESVRVAVEAVTPEPVAVAVEASQPTFQPVRLAAELSTLLGANGSTPRVNGDNHSAVVTATEVAAEEAPLEAAAAIAGGSDAAAVLEAPAEVMAVEAVVPAEPQSEPQLEPQVEPQAEPQTEEQKALVADASRASKIAAELGIQLPHEGALTRQWIDFLNQMAK